VAPYPTYRGDLVLDIEGRLDEARTLASSLDEAHALALLGSVEQDLMAHPELPQAAWLLAERHRIEAEVLRTDPAESARADALSEAALALEGPRAVAFGAPNGESGAEPARVSVGVRDLDARDRLEIDGRSGAAERNVAPGLHQLRVLRDGELVFASWEKLGDRANVTLGVPPVTACSLEELAAADARGARVTLSEPVSCPRWFVARRAASGLEVADCRANACGAFVPLVESRPSAAPFPAWATATLVGAGAVAASMLALWAAGGFEHESQAPGKTVFVYGGLH
jgi:hypothetical protein